VKHVIYPCPIRKNPTAARTAEAREFQLSADFLPDEARCDRVVGCSSANNHAVAVLHSNRTQREREQALQGFRSGRYEVLVATDIAARGLDIADVSHVINYDVPQHPEDYIIASAHGPRKRTATPLPSWWPRAATCSHRTVHQPENPRVKLENFDYHYTALFEEGKPGQPQAVFPAKCAAAHPAATTSPRADGEGKA